MKILLLGASGQLGQEWQYVVKQLSVDDILLVPYTSSQLNITDYDEVKNELEKQQGDAIINCAAYTKVDEAENHKDQAKKVNADAVSHLATISEALGYKLVHYSTDYIFRGTKDDRENYPDGYAEDHPAEPINWYGQTKWQGEQAIRQATDNYLIVRTSWLCGQFGNNFVTKMLDLAKKKDKLQVVDDQWGSPSFTENIVSNSLNLLRSQKTGTYHITSEGLITWYQFAKAVFESSEIQIALEKVSSEAFETKARRPYFSKLCTKKLERTTGSKIVNWKTELRKLMGQLND